MSLLFSQAVDIIFLFLISQISFSSSQNERFEVALSSQYTLGWEITKDGQTIMFDVVAETNGWVGLGLSPTGNMANGDIFIAGFDPLSPEIFYSQDYHVGGANGHPVTDTTKDWFLNVAQENNTHTMLLFERKLNTGDSEDIEITGNDIFVIWAFGNTDSISYHGSSRGQRLLNLLIPTNETSSPTSTSTPIPISTPTSTPTSVSTPIPTPTSSPNPLTISATTFESEAPTQPSTQVTGIPTTITSTPSEPGRCSVSAEPLQLLNIFILVLLAHQLFLWY